jgi:hypothetical protein
MSSISRYLNFDINIVFNKNLNDINVTVLR